MRKPRWYGSNRRELACLKYSSYVSKIIKAAVNVKGYVSKIFKLVYKRIKLVGERKRIV